MTDDRLAPGPDGGGNDGAGAEARPAQATDRPDPQWGDREPLPPDGQANRERPRARLSHFDSRREPPSLLCCRPLWLPWPSGHHWSHADRCPAEVDGRKRRRQKVEVPTDLIWLDLPKVGSRAETWLRHPPGHRCDDCQYVEAHLDDDDDDGRPLPTVLETEG